MRVDLEKCNLPGCQGVEQDDEHGSEADTNEDTSDPQYQRRFDRVAVLAGHQILEVSHRNQQTARQDSIFNIAASIKNIPAEDGAEIVRRALLRWHDKQGHRAPTENFDPGSD